MNDYPPLPHDPNVENALIASILLDPKVLTDLRSNMPITEDDFHTPDAKLMYRELLRLSESGAEINVSTLANALRATPSETEHQNQLERIGGAQRILALLRSLPASNNAPEDYARILLSSRTMRNLIDAGARIAELGHTAPADQDLDSVLQQAESLLHDAHAATHSRDFTSLSEVLSDQQKPPDPNHTHDLDEEAPVPTGLMPVDIFLGLGMHRSDMITIAARPSLGKTSLILNIAQLVAEQGHGVAIFSPEMSSAQIGTRLLSSTARIPSDRIRSMYLGLDEEVTLLNAIGHLSDLPLWIDDSPYQTASEIRSKLKTLMSENQISLAILDYIQLVEPERNAQRQSRVNQLSQTSRMIKATAREMKIPFIACSQLNRAIEMRPSHRPLLSDLRESGGIEQDSDIVAFIHREDAYTTEEEWYAENPMKPYPRNAAEIIFAKHRNGPTGSVPLYFRQEFTTFEAIAESIPY